MATVGRALSNPVAVNPTEESFPEDEVIIIERVSSPSSPSSPPPYSMQSPLSYEHSEGPPHLTVFECMCEILLRGRMFTPTPISRVSQDIRQRQASTVQHNHPPSPKFMITLPAGYKRSPLCIITTSYSCLKYNVQAEESV